MRKKDLIKLTSDDFIIADGARTIDLHADFDSIDITDLAYIYNKTQDKLYFGQAQGLSKASVSGSTITIDSSFPVLADSDEMHIQLWVEPVDICSEMKHFVRGCSINASTSVQIANIGYPFALEHLEFSCDSLNKVRIKITPPDVSYNVLYNISTDGASISISARPDNIVNTASGLWDILEHDENNNLYKYRLRLNGLKFPQGVLIELENTDSSAHNGAVNIIGRKLL